MKRYFNFDWDKKPLIEKEASPSKLKDRLRDAYQDLWKKKMAYQNNVNGETETDCFASINDIKDQASYREGISLFQGKQNSENY